MAESLPGQGVSKSKKVHHKALGYRVDCGSYWAYETSEKISEVTCLRCLVMLQNKFYREVEEAWEKWKRARQQWLGSRGKLADDC